MSTMEVVIDSGLAEAAATSSLNRQRELRFFCDAELISREKLAFPAHRAILASKSTYFHDMFAGSFSESKGKVNTAWSSDTLQQILNYIYVGSVQLTKSNSLELAQAAHIYDLPALFKAVVEKLPEFLDSDNCVDIAVTARRLGAEELRRKAIKFVQMNLSSVSLFEELEGDDLVEISSDAFIHDNSFVDKMVSWVQRSKDYTNAARILQCLDFEILSVASLKKVQEVFVSDSDCAKIVARKMIEEKIRASEFQLPWSSSRKSSSFFGERGNRTGGIRSFSSTKEKGKEILTSISNTQAWKNIGRNSFHLSNTQAWKDIGRNSLIHLSNTQAWKDFARNCLIHFYMIGQLLCQVIVTAIQLIYGIFPRPTQVRIVAFLFLVIMLVLEVLCSQYCPILCQKLRGISVLIICLAIYFIIFPREYFAIRRHISMVWHARFRHAPR